MSQENQSVLERGAKGQDEGAVGHPKFLAVGGSSQTFSHLKICI